MPMLNRIENYGNNHIEGEFLELAFDTEYRGIWQCRWTMTGMSQYSSEPPLESLKKAEQKQIRRESLIIFKFTFGKLPNL